MSIGYPWKLSEMSPQLFNIFLTILALLWFKMSGSFPYIAIHTLSFLVPWDNSKSGSSYEYNLPQFSKKIPGIFPRIYFLTLVHLV